ncbi:ModD protein [Breoghania sp. JC706]|uniref:ModD protein n=1 Tax=Breoghania sp. JC706 TaxID=3117732 RepID=UPI0030098187
MTACGGRSGTGRLSCLRLGGIGAGILKDVELEVAPGGLLAIIGPSGAGKSTLLKVIAGLMPHRGFIECGGPGFERLPPYLRNIGYVPQDLCLFPHKTVAGNLRLALGRSRFAKADWPGRIMACLDMLRIAHLADRLPGRISGGERQRAALARALVGEPSLMLLDEPFSSLDPETAERLRGELRTIHDRLGLTTLMVTHNMDEAFGLADRVLRMEDGRLRPAERRLCGTFRRESISRPEAPDAVRDRSTCQEQTTMITLSDAELDALVAQDVPMGDLTTDILGIGAEPARMTFTARDETVLCGSEEAARMIELADGRVLSFAASGTRVAPGTVFLEAEGSAASLHRTWKVAMTLVEYASGIATRAGRLVAAARSANPDIGVACTRKNFPGTKAISVKAVMAGGASIHRLGLSETVLVFPNHTAFLSAPLEAWVARAKAQAAEKKLMVEADEVEEAEALARAGVDVLQLDKMPVAAVAEVVARVKRLGLSTVVTATGGINEENAAAYAATGCALLVTSSCYFGRPADVKATILPKE